MTRQSSTPALPAPSPESAAIAEAAQNIVLRRSGFMLAAQGIFVLTATFAVYHCLASYLSTWQDVPLALAVGALFLLSVVRNERVRPSMLKIGADGLSAWNQAGDLLMQGRIAGCAHWSDRLLVLVLKPDHGVLRTLLLPADALAMSAFRKLAVLGRRAVGA
ncbi:MAG: FIG00454574: hypothetical protein [uncultured Paraburkholderia sp.]|nr:MAG: FIG00454574: hypothetical protein [uncultured Paraburkholderia sp.]CAH2937059.1 MAG: FIG00454574: hypothetical protein [uncultured Paraburkholderia sp.]